MTYIDKLLENLRKEVELTGRSGSDCIYRSNLNFSFSCEDFEIPSEADYDAATVDFYWFLSCSKTGVVGPHSAPQTSFWLNYFGPKALPYGYTWRLKELYNTLRNPEKWRRAVLHNPAPTDNPPCIMCYQFQTDGGREIDCTVTMRSSDVAKVLPQDVLMSWLLLRHVCQEVKMQPGQLTFNIGNAHVYYADAEYQEENVIDGLD